MNPAIGDKSMCELCSYPIRFVGHYWEHIGISPRHPARPKIAPTPLPPNLESDFLELKSRVVALEEKLKALEPSAK